MISAERSSARYAALFGGIAGAPNRPMTCIPTCYFVAETVVMLAWVPTTAAVGMK